MILRLDKKVADWIAQGLISVEQGQRLLEQEDNASRPWVLYGVAGIGVTTVFTGILSLVAANWEQIPVVMKLLSYLLLQTVAGFALWKGWERDNWVRESVLVFYVLLFLAGIGLTAQVFHLGSEGWQGLLFWLGLSLPVVLGSRSALPNHLWIGGFAVTATIWVVVNRTWIPNEAARLMVFCSLPFWVAALGFWGHQFRGLSHHFKVAAIIWALVVILPIATPFGNSQWSSWRSLLPAEHAGYLWIPWVALLVATAGSFFRPDIPRAARWSTSLLLLSLGVYLTIPNVWGDTSLSLESVPLRVAGCAGFIWIWALAATSSAILRYRRLFDVATLIIALRLVTVYFEIFGDLSQTGWGLILSGTLLLGITYGWWRSRRQLETWVGGLR